MGQEMRRDPHDLVVEALLDYIDRAKLDKKSMRRAFQQAFEKIMKRKKFRDDQIKQCSEETGLEYAGEEKGADAPMRD